MSYKPIFYATLSCFEHMKVFRSLEKFNLSFIESNLAVAVVQSENKFNFRRQTPGLIKIHRGVSDMEQITFTLIL
jgi:hypothetical protein